jgi:hypothetical protein
MHYSEALTHIETRIPYNLNDYDNHMLSSSGELALSSRLTESVFLSLGRDILELSRVSYDTTEAPASRRSPDDDQAANLYVLRNVSHTDAMATIDDAREPVGDVVSPEPGRLRLLGRKTLIIGTECSPELQLNPKYCSPQHMQIRIGNMAGRLHFSELGSREGTVVHLTQEQSNRVAAPRREFRKIGKQIMTIESLRGRWSR